MSIKRQFSVFLIRWALNSLGLWVAVRILGVGLFSDQWIVSLLVLVFAGFVFSVVNSVLRPIIVIVSLPAIVLTLGLFTLIINGLMVYLSLKLAPGIDMTFGNAIIAGIILSLINYIVSVAIEIRSEKYRSDNVIG